MKVIEKFNYDKGRLMREFDKFSHRDGRYVCDTWASESRNALFTSQQNSSAEAFCDWAWSEYPEYRKFQILEHRFIVLDNKPSVRQDIVVVDIFCTGWAYHYNLLRERGRDVSKPYADREKSVNIYDVLGYDGDGARIHSMTAKQAVGIINDKLRELARLPPARGYQFIVSQDAESRPFYDTYADAIQYLKERIKSGSDSWEDMELLKRMGLGKWVVQETRKGGTK